MRKAVSCIIIILAILFMTVSVPTTAFASSLSDNAVITLSGEITEQEIVVKAYLRQNTAINGMTAEISYDTSAMTLKNVEQGTALSHLDDAPIATGDWDYSATPFIITWSGNENDDSTGLLLTMYFTVNETANDGEYAITLKTERDTVTYIDGGVKTKSALIDGVKIKIKGSVAETIVTETTANTNNASKTILIVSSSTAAVTIVVFTVVLIVKLRGKKAWTKIE